LVAADKYPLQPNTLAREVRIYDIIFPMSKFHFYYPLQIRYGDLDPQWHLNNAHTVILFEQGRFAYIQKLGLWDGKDFNKLGLIVADVHVAYLAPVLFNQNVHAGVRVSRLGNKSLVFEYSLEDRDSGEVLAKAETVMVAYDYLTRQSMPIPEDWRAIIRAFEGLD
jgi:acyl-CoA thioester hydrolase